jgi:hypothetical protein
MLMARNRRGMKQEFEAPSEISTTEEALALGDMMSYIPRPYRGKPGMPKRGWLAGGPRSDL